MQPGHQGGKRMTKRVTIKDIAKECGVSITTVSRILNKKPGCCTPETEKRVMEAVELSLIHI